MYYILNELWKHIQNGVICTLYRYLYDTYGNVGASTVSFVGEPSLSDLKTGSKMWHPKSPSCPVPYACQPRQLNGAYAPGM